MSMKEITEYKEEIRKAGEQTADFWVNLLRKHKVLKEEDLEKFREDCILKTTEDLELDEESSITIPGFGLGATCTFVVVVKNSKIKGIYIREEPFKEKITVEKVFEIPLKEE